MDRYIRNYFLVVVAGMFCWLNASIVSAQTATNVDCFWCVGPGEVGYNAVPWAALDPSLRQALQAQQDKLDALQARVDASELIVLDFTDPDACVIDQPGHYTLDRDWRRGSILCLAEFAESDFTSDTLILISADNVIFDLNGFEIRDAFESDSLLLKATGARVTVRNGTLLGAVEAAPPGFSLSVSGGFSLIENITSTNIAIGNNGLVRNVRTAGERVYLGQGSVLENSAINCVVASSDTIVRFNTMSICGEFDNSTTVLIRGDNVLVEGNVLTRGGDDDTRNEPAIVVDGNSNTIVRNTLQLDGSGPGPKGVAVSVNGTGNIIDSNIIKPAYTTGIQFGTDGNFYGGNRASATTPFDLGGTTQTDWGGNVSF